VIRIIGNDTMKSGFPAHRRLTPARAVAAAVVVAMMVFFGVQDRFTSLGVGQYVAFQRAALDGRGPAVTVDSVMQPWVRTSVRVALAWSAVPLLLGLGGAVALARSARRA